MTGEGREAKTAVEKGDAFFERRNRKMVRV